MKTTVEEVEMIYTSSFYFSFRKEMIFLPNHPLTHYTDGCKYNLINARLSLGMTQEKMAEKLNISRSAYAQIENGLRPGAYYVWDQLEDMLGIEQPVLKLSLDTVTE